MFVDTILIRLRSAFLRRHALVVVHTPTSHNGFPNLSLPFCCMFYNNTLQCDVRVGIISVVWNPLTITITTTITDTWWTITSIRSATRRLITSSIIWMIFFSISNRIRRGFTPTSRSNFRSSTCRLVEIRRTVVWVFS